MASALKSLTGVVTQKNKNKIPAKANPTVINYGPNQDDPIFTKHGIFRGTEKGVE